MNIGLTNQLKAVLLTPAKNEGDIGSNENENMVILFAS